MLHDIENQLNISSPVVVSFPSASQIAPLSSISSDPWISSATTNPQCASPRTELLNDLFPTNAKTDNADAHETDQSPFVYTKFDLTDQEDLLTLAVNGNCIDEVLSICPSTPRSPLTAQELGEIEEAAGQVEDIIKNGKLLIDS